MPDATPAASEAPETQENAEAVAPEVIAQAENPDAVRAAIKRRTDEAKEAKAEAADLRAKLNAYEDRDKTEQEKLADAAKAATARAESAESKLLRFEVATEKGLDIAAASFLTGSSREEMEANADRLTGLLQSSGTPATPGFDGGVRKTPERVKPPEEAHADFLAGLFGSKPT